MMVRIYFASLVICCSSFLPAANAQSIKFDPWPKEDSPQQMGKLLADHFVTSPHQYASGTLHYSEVVTWYGALAFAYKTHDVPLLQQLVKKFDPLMPGGSEADLIPVSHSVDDSVFGIVPLEIGMDTGDKRYLAYGMKWADQQWENPLPDGMTSEARYWVDDMYMITILQIQAYRASHDKKYLDHACSEVVAYLAKLQRPNGLFFHGTDVPIYWGRGNGWAAAGMVELLQAMPEDYPQRQVIMRGYRAMMKALLKYQGKDGLWRQVIDDDKAWPETSGSAMFAFSMITGVEKGWLAGDEYVRSAQKAWIALVGYIDRNGDVTSVSEGTNKKNDLAYYLARRRITGDYHGQAPMLWTAAALLQ